MFGAAARHRRARAAEKNRLTQADVEFLNKVFFKYDISGDGVIDKQELGSLMADCNGGKRPPLADIETMIRACNTKNRSATTLSFDEFLQTIKMWYLTTGKKELEKQNFGKKKKTEAVQFSATDIQMMTNAFFQGDASGDGLIDKGELHKLVKKIGMPSADKHTVNAIVRRYDDGDGLLNFQEFMEVVKELHQIAAGGKHNTRTAKLEDEPKDPDSPREHHSDGQAFKRAVSKSGQLIKVPARPSTSMGDMPIADRAKTGCRIM